MRAWTKNQVGSFNVFPFSFDFLFGVVGDKSKREEEKGGGRRVDARRCWLSGQEQQGAGGGAGAGGRRQEKQDTGGGKEGWHRSTLRCSKHCRKSGPPPFLNFLFVKVLVAFN